MIARVYDLMIHISLCMWEDRCVYPSILLRRCYNAEYNISVSFFSYLRSLVWFVVLRRRVWGKVLDVNFGDLASILRPCSLLAVLFHFFYAIRIV